MYFTYARDQAGQFGSFLLDTYFTPQRVGARQLSASDLQTYVTNVQNSVRKWDEIHFPSRATAQSESVRRGLERLDRLGRGAFGPLLMAAMQVGGNDQSGLLALLQASERFIFIVSRVCQRRADTGDSEFYRLAHEVFDGQKTLAQAVQTINERSERHFSVEKAITDMRELFRYEQGFYSWGGLRFFLFEYEQDLKERAGMEAAKLDWSEFTTGKRDHVTIEHIYPVTPRLGEWPSFEARPKREYEALLNSLGNLLALSQSRNSRFSNRAFRAKKQDAEAVAGYYNGSYSEIAVAQVVEWTPEAVLTRGLEILDFLEQRWAVSFGSRWQKIQFLNLDFMEQNSAT
jgi:hypothetical protein